MTKMICVRISDEEKRQLQKYGKFSDTIRAAMKLYLNTKKSDELLQKLGRFASKKSHKDVN